MSRWAGGRLTRVTTNPAGAAHIRDSLAPAGLLPRILRSI